MSRRWVVHLPFVAPNLSSAQRLARVVAHWFGVLPQSDAGETTLSEEDNQGVRLRVFCDNLLPGGRRCVLRAGHDGDCARRIRH